MYQNRASRNVACPVWVSLFCLATLVFVSCSPPADFSLEFSFSGPSVNPEAIYTVWIEDEEGTNLQNLYVCGKMVSLLSSVPDTLTGDCLPNWLKEKYPDHSSVDGVTGPSTQQGISVKRDIQIGSVRRFRVCLEIDRSENGNDHFIDRPAFTYATELIDLDDLQDAYPLSLIGWMSNDTDESPFGQQPTPAISGYAPYEFMTDTGWIEDADGSTDDMVDSAEAVVTAK